MESESDSIEAPEPVRKRRPRKPKPVEPVATEPPEIPSLREPDPDDLEFPETPAVEWPAEASRSIKDYSVLLLALAFLLFLVSQAAELAQSAEALRWQTTNLDRQVEGLAANKSNLVTLVQQRQTLVDQSQRVTSSYNELLNDLIRLAETDSDARAVVEKFQIKSSGVSLPSAAPPAKK